MSSRFPAVAITTFLLGVTIPVAFALQERPQWIDEEFRRCMRTVVEYDQQERIDAQRDYHDEVVRAMEFRKASLHSAWHIADRDDRRDALRDAERAYRDDVKDAKRDLDQRVRDLRREVRDRERECEDREDEHEEFIDDLCITSQDCSRNRVCSTERGDCRPSCPSDVQTCVQVCAGVCERSSSSRSSRSSSSRSSSRSSLPGGVNCQPYQCPDGREFPACDSNGNPVNYFQNPCYT